MTRPYTTRRSHHAPASIDGDSTLSDFDPDHEAMVSTRQLDHSDKLPDIPASLRTTPRGKSPVLDPEYTVDTSTIQHTFPQISDVESSGDDETHEFSIEIGRGMKKQHQQLHRGDDSRNSMLSIGNPSIRSSSPAIKLDFPATSTPPRSALRNAKRAAADGSNLRKDAQIRRASQMQKENVDPQASRVRSMSGIPTEARHTLSEMHIKAREAYDGSFIGDERPKNISLNTRTTRFGNVSSQVAAAVENAQREGQLRESRRGKQSVQNYQPANPTYTLDTANSFLLPDMPNISELVSGVLEDGTPVFQRQMRPRTTRFVSPPAEDPEASQPQGHLPLEAVPIPEDEKVMFVSLKLLQDKVADLEFAKSEAERKLDDVRQENHLLRAEKSRRQKEQNDRLKMFGGDEPEVRSGGAKSLQEKNSQYSANPSLNDRLTLFFRTRSNHFGIAEQA
jgi:hypothetical protein